MDLTEIKKIPIIDVAIKLGINVRIKKAMCFTGHDKNSPSLSFYEKDNTWKCFGACGKSGDAISLVEEYLQVSFIESIKWFECYGIYQTNIKRDIKPKVRNPPKIIPSPKEEVLPDGEIYCWLMSRCGVVKFHLGVEYLKNHGITDEIAMRYGVKE
jgi:DNA primase